jgi:hypothetical protein
MLNGRTSQGRRKPGLSSWMAMAGGGWPCPHLEGDSSGASNLEPTVFLQQIVGTLGRTSIWPGI